MHKFAFGAFLFLFAIVIAYAQIGSQCSRDADCLENFLCIQNACECKPKHIQSGLFCFPEVQYGEECWFQDQCTDYRQICRNNSHIGGKRCLCDKYHEYNETILQCIPKKNLTSLLEEKYNTLDLISGQAMSTFYGILVIGLLIAAVGFFCLIVASFYCFRMYLKDKKLDNEVNSLIVKNGGKPGGRVVKSDSQRKRQEAGAGPMYSGAIFVA